MSSPDAALECPVCGMPGRTVSGVTLDHHLERSRRRRFGDEARFCPNPDCEAVYFGGSAVVRKGETALPVTQKDQGDEVFLCYCFGHTRGDLRRDLARTGATDIPDRIKQGIKEGRCDCGRKNPQGSCCLGNVAAAIGEAGRGEGV